VLFEFLVIAIVEGRVLVRPNPPQQLLFHERAEDYLVHVLV
jgi:hypothetical protein